MEESQEDCRTTATLREDRSYEKEYIPPKMEVLKQYSISIQFHDVGCTVQVGCKSVAFNTIESAMEAINTYVKDPYMEQQKWQKIFQQK
jgi:hypothetical protein